MTSREATKPSSGPGPALVSDLSLSDIVVAAVELLDERGLDGFSMRALGERLGRSAMAAYRHVSDRDELVQLAAQAVQHELPDVDHLPWHERLEAFARHGWRTSWRPHPWLVDLIGGGTMSGFEQRRQERMERVFREAGFGETDIFHALAAHWSFVIGTLQLIRTIASHDVDAPDGNEIFEFNLRAWILGLGAKAAGASMGDIAGATSRPNH
jgi:AcrR family transcriptional regulator